MKFIDLFCGAGFGASGVVKTGGIPVLAVDSWELATANYQHNFKKSHTITSPIESLNPSDISRKLNVDLMIASPECTSHSIARGSKPCLESSRETAINVIPWISEFKPQWIILENVVRMRNWNRHSELKASLKNLGYEVNEMVLNAADFGVPQNRKRLFLICGLDSVPPSEQDLQTMSNTFSPKSAKMVIDFSDRWPTTPLYTETRAKRTIERAEKAIKELGRDPFLIVYYGSDYAGGWQSIDLPLRTITTLDRFALVAWRKNEYRIRMLQLPELMKAMGAPKGYELIYGNRRDKIKLCGNGVCAPVIESIVRIIKNNNHRK